MWYILNNHVISELKEFSPVTTATRRQTFENLADRCPEKDVKDYRLSELSALETALQEFESVPMEICP